MSHTVTSPGEPSPQDRHSPDPWSPGELPPAPVRRHEHERQHVSSADHMRAAAAIRKEFKRFLLGWCALFLAFNGVQVRGAMCVSACLRRANPGRPRVRGGRGVMPPRAGSVCGNRV